MLITLAPGPGSGVLGREGGSLGAGGCCSFSLCWGWAEDPELRGGRISRSVALAAAAHRFPICGLVSAQTRPLFPTCAVSFSPVCGREQIRPFQRSRFQSRESEKMSIEDLIETNKKWLEDFKRNSKVTPLPGSGL